MKKYTGILVIILLLLSLTSCKGILEDAATSTVYIQSNGDVFEAVIEEFDTKVYDKDDLEKVVEQEVKDYNQNEERVKLTKFTVSDDVAKAWLSYAGLEDFNSFNGLEYEQLDEIDSKMQGTLYKVADESETSFKSIQLKDGQHVLFVPEAVDMKVDGTIIYTTKDVKVNDSKDTATTIEGNNYIIYEEQ